MCEHHYFTTGDCGTANTMDRSAPHNEDVQINCRTFGTITIPADTEVGTEFQLVNLNVDTKEYKKPCIKLEFLSNILTATATGTLNFQVLRQCSGQLTPVPVSAGWTFSRAVATVDEANSFGFITCDCDTCNCGCCNYSIVATVVGAPTTGTITINNATLVTTVVEGSVC